MNMKLLKCLLLFTMYYNITNFILKYSTTLSSDKYHYILLLSSYQHVLSLFYKYIT